MTARGNGTAVTPGTDTERTASGVSGIFRRLLEDIQWAFTAQILCGIGGSWWTPRLVRRALYSAAGASVASSPGAGFVFAGQARHLNIGRGVYLNQRIFIEAVSTVAIGDACSLGMGVMVLTSHHPLDAAGRWQAAAQGRPVSIGNRVWIGARATILPGAIIDDDVVIAAGAVVAGRCYSHGVYGGVPARRIRDYVTAPDSAPSDYPASGVPVSGRAAAMAPARNDAATGSGFE